MPRRRVVGVDEREGDARVAREVAGLGPSERGVDDDVVAVQFDPHRRDVGLAVGVDAGDVGQDLLGEDGACRVVKVSAHGSPDGQRLLAQVDFSVMNIGAHVRGGGKLIPSLEAGVEIGATSIQIFTQSPRMWKPSQYAPEVLAAYREAQAQHPSVTHTFCHATYLINLASPDKELYEKSVDCLTTTSRRAGHGRLGRRAARRQHMGTGFEGVVNQIREAFERALDRPIPRRPGSPTARSSSRTPPAPAGRSDAASRRSRR
jgi:hypothetical protein